MYRENPETKIKGGYVYVVSNDRMQYNPKFHKKRWDPYTPEELKYMCSVWDGKKKADIAMALGRTHGSILTKANELRHTWINGVNQFEYWKQRGKEL